MASLHVPGEGNKFCIARSAGVVVVVLHPVVVPYYQFQEFNFAQFYITPASANTCSIMFNNNNADAMLLKLQSTVLRLRQKKRADREKLLRFVETLSSWLSRHDVRLNELRSQELSEFNGLVSNLLSPTKTKDSQEKEETTPNKASSFTIDIDLDDSLPSQPASQLPRSSLHSFNMRSNHSLYTALLFSQRICFWKYLIYHHRIYGCASSRLLPNHFLLSFKANTGSKQRNGTQISSPPHLTQYRKKATTRFASSTTRLSG